MDSRLIIVSNRLPLSISLSSDNAFTFTSSSGGLVSGLNPFFNDESDCIWIGWADVDCTLLHEKDCNELSQQLLERNCVPVYLERDESTAYYEGLSNSSIWPLFHSFPQLARFDDDEWQSYVRVNEQFCEAIVQHARPTDTFWIHDYHLMLLPKMLRERLPEASIGFFLHIPFPAFETYRMMPWRRELLEGVLGADLVGFHTYDYVRYFLESCSRVLGYGNEDGSIETPDRTVVSDAFPMGIDYRVSPTQR